MTGRVQREEQVCLRGPVEARREAALDRAAEHPVFTHSETLGVARLGAQVGEIDLTRPGRVGVDEEGGVFDLDLAAEVPDLDHEDALGLGKADALLQHLAQARVGDGLALVREVPVAPQQQSGRTKRRGAPQGVQGSARTLASRPIRTLPQKS